jgi:hypothetical protein
MPADKLTLLCPRLSRQFEKIADRKGKPKAGYSRFLDLRSECKLPTFLYHGGFYNDINKLEFIDVAHLGLSRITELADEIFGALWATRIFRIDWCVDLLGVPLMDLALYCRIPFAQNCSVERSRSGVTVYLRRSKDNVLLVYDRLARLKSTGAPLVKIYDGKDYLTRVEVQFRGGGVPIRRFSNIRKYARIDLLPDLAFWKLPLKRHGLRPIESLAAEGLLNRIQNLGLQATSKTFSSQEWAYLTKKFLQQRPERELPDLNELMRKSTWEWLNDRVRFPRGR